MPDGLVIDELCLTPMPPSGTRRGRIRPADGPETLPILSGISLSVAPGEFVALVGASGSGKTLTATSVLGLLPPDVRMESGAIHLGGTDLGRASEAELNRVRGGRIGMLFQQPKRMFNPRRRVASHVEEPLRLHRGLRGSEARKRAIELLAEAGLDEPDRRAKAYPHQLSGGMAQRAMIAAALAGQPELLLADEPTSSLDKVLERQILDMIDRRRQQDALGVLYITHDLATVAAYADRIVVMESGRIEEAGRAADVLGNPQKVCTKKLLAASALVSTPTLRPTAQGRPVLALDRVTKRYPAAKRGGRPALERTSLTVHQGEILGVLGQSGSGKSTLARLAVGLETPDTGSVMRPPGTKVQLVFQEPYDAFDPRLTIRSSLEAPLLQHKGDTSSAGAERIRQSLRDVGLNPILLEKYPGQCSGGQLQRLTIARALLLEPEVLICDEATSALDTVAQRNVLDLLLRLHKDRGLSLVVISHDMNVIRYMSTRVAVLHQGALVELAGTAAFFGQPRHEHSKQLISAGLTGPREDRLRQATAHDATRT